MRIYTLAVSICIFFCSVAFAQIPFPGNDNAAGVTSYGFPNCYTGNLSFSTKDIVVAGAVGKRGLIWKRRATSRTSQANSLFGIGHNWTHNWQWEMVYEGTDSAGRSIISVHKPSGIVHRFIETAPGKWSSGPNVRDRLIVEDDVFTLQKRTGDVAQVRFTRELTLQGYIFTLKEYIDDQSNIWTFTYSSGQLAQITEPAGRWLKIHYENLYIPNEIGNIPPFTVISRVAASNGQEVIYNYEFPASADYPVLSGVVYPDESKAVYTYAAQHEARRPLLIKADDPRGDSRLRGRVFSYRPETEAPSGQIKDIRSSGNGEIMVALSKDKNGLRNYAVREINGSIVHRTYFAGGNIAELIDGLGFSKKYEYSDNGRGFLVTAIDELDNSTRHEYNSSGDRIRTIYPDNTSCLWQYDPKGRLLGKTDELGNSYAFERDQYGRVVKVIYPDGNTTEMTYNKFGQILTIKDLGGNVTTFNMNNRGLCTSVTDPMGNVTSTSYDKHDRISKIIDPGGNDTILERDKAGRVIRTIFSDGASEFKTHDRFGNITKRVDPMGNCRTTVYDDFGRIVLAKDAEGHETLYEYAPMGQKGASRTRAVKLRSPDNLVSLTSFDANGRAVAITSASGTPNANTIRFSYDEKGRKIGMTNALGQTVRYLYDKRDRITRKISALGHTRTYEYNAVGLKVSETDANGHTARWAYDEAGRKIAKTDAKGQTYQRTYYPSGRLATLIDPKGNTYQYEYDAAGRKTALIYPDGSYESWTYNAAGKKETYTNRSGITCTYVYDSRNRMILSQWSDGSQKIIRDYDASGRVTSIDNGTSTLTFTYDKNSRILTETQDLSAIVTNSNFDPVPRTVRYAYKDNGKLDSITYPDGTALEYSYTPEKRLQEILLKGGTQPVIRYEYDASGNATRTPRENSTESEREYDEDNKVIQIVENDPELNALSLLGYEYDKTDNPLSIVNFIGSEVYQNQYEYDPTNQLIGVDHIKDVSTEADRKITNQVKYVFDEVGNRVEVYNDGEVTLYSVNNLNEYTQVGAIHPQYEPNGNLSQIGGWSYEYDALNRLVKASDGKVSAQFYYDARNRAVARNYNGKITLNTYSGWNLIEERDDQDRQKARYIHGRKVDEIIAMVNRHGIFYPHHDALGNVTMLTDSDGKLVERYNYSSSGKVQIFNARGTALDVSSVDNRWMFTGREWLPEIELYDYRNRLYSAKLGRFLQTDPIRFNAGDINLYRYVFNNPIRFTDPYGLEVRVYSSDAFGIAGINHAFVWSTETGQGVGRNGSSGNAWEGPGHPRDFNPNIAPYNTWQYNVVNDLNSMTEGQFINSIRTNPSLNDGFWVPYVNDCHTDLNDAFNDAGVYYPGAPNDRVDLDNWFIDSLNTAIDWVYDVFDSWFGDDSWLE